MNKKVNNPSEKKEKLPPQKKDPPSFKRNEKLNIHQRINLVMADVEKLLKLKRVDLGEGGYNVVTSDQVTAHVQPLLVKYGVMIIPTVTEWGVVDPEPSINEKTGKRYPFRTEATVRVRWVNIDDDADFFENEWFGFGIDPSDKGPGKATTYAVRYLILKTLLIPTGDKDSEDGNDDSPTGTKTRSGGKKYPSGPPKTGGVRRSGSTIPFPKRKINEAQEVKLRKMVEQYAPPEQFLAEWMAETKKEKFLDLTNEGMDHLIFKLTSGVEGKKLEGTK